MAATIFFENPESSVRLGCWENKAGNFRIAIGYTAWGDFFLQNPDTRQFAILYAFNPEIVPLHFNTIDAFKSEYLHAPEVQSHLIRPERLVAVEARLGALSEGEVFIPELFPFLGGSCEPESYAKGNLWTFIDFVGQLQGVVDEA
jgi:hypothetical protein